MKLTILSWAACGGGRAKALLSIADRCQSNGIDTTIVTGDSWPVGELESHHGIDITANWQSVEWDTANIADVVSRTNPDVILAFDTLLIKRCRNIDTYTIGYLRTRAVPGVDEYWCPSKQCAEQFRPKLDAPVYPLYPIWYIEAGNNPPLETRQFDVLIHGRKLNNAIENLTGSYNILLANRFSYPELREIYSQTKLFLFPERDRFEPLGLMPIEAAAHGCQLALTRNSGVAECFPSQSFKTPSNHVERLLEQPEKQSYTLPASPTDPVKRIKSVS